MILDRELWALWWSHNLYGTHPSQLRAHVTCVSVCRTWCPILTCEFEHTHTHMHILAFFWVEARTFFRTCMWNFVQQDLPKGSGFAMQSVALSSLSGRLWWTRGILFSMAQHHCCCIVTMSWLRSCRFLPPSIAFCSFVDPWLKFVLELVFLASTAKQCSTI